MTTAQILVGTLILVLVAVLITKFLLRMRAKTPLYARVMEEPRSCGELEELMSRFRDLTPRSPSAYELIAKIKKQAEETIDLIREPDHPSRAELQDPARMRDLIAQMEVYVLERLSASEKLLVDLSNFYEKMHSLLDLQKTLRIIAFVTVVGG